MVGLKHLNTVQNMVATIFSSDTLNVLGFGVAIVDADTRRIVYVNEKVLAMTGFTAGQLLNQECHCLLCPAQQGDCPILDGGQSLDNSERRMLRADGEKMPIIKTVIPMKLGDKKYLVESIIDNSLQRAMREMLTLTNSELKTEIDKRIEIQAKLKQLAYHDFLTGLPNRLLVVEELKNAICRSRYGAQEIAVFFLDLDGFKLVNDTLGHAAGDQVLVNVAKRLVQAVRHEDIVARIGGDEFVVVAQDVGRTDGVGRLADKILAIFDRPVQIGGEDFYITTSLGVASYPRDGHEPEMLIKNADIAMYKAKEKGRNQWAQCTPDLKRRATEFVRFRNQLHQALAANEFILYYQPQVNCRTDTIIGVEALIRWQHPELGMISPAQFIPIAEQTGLIHAIGEWVLRTACSQNQRWQSNGLPKVPVAVNLSALQVNHPYIGKITEEILLETGLEPRYLELEITESVAMHEPQQAINTLHSLKEKGVTIAIDDFGTEYSCLNYMKHLPVDKIKIARPFVQGIEFNGKDAAIAKTLLLLAKSMELRVIAEGVETRSQLAFLQQHGCEEVQGYYYYPPLPAREAADVLALHGRRPVACLVSGR